MTFYQSFYTVFPKRSFFGSAVVLYTGVNYSKKKYDNELKLAKNKQMTCSREKQSEQLFSFYFTWCTLNFTTHCS